MRQLDGCAVGAFMGEWDQWGPSDRAGDRGVFDSRAPPRACLHFPGLEQDAQKPLSSLWSEGSGAGPTSCHLCGTPKSDLSPGMTSASPTLSPLFCPKNCYSLTLSQGPSSSPIPHCDRQYLL